MLYKGRMKKSQSPDKKILILFAGLALALSIGFVLLKNNAPVDQAEKSPYSKGIGGPFSLTDHNGIARTERDFDQSYKLIYFGFTYCPAICPTELQKITAVMTMLPPPLANKIQPLFITVDPQRDTQEIMKNYVSLFHEKIIGLTGTPEQIEQAKQAYRVYAKKVQDETLTDYTVDHSSYIYLMSPDNQLLGMYRTKDSAQDLVSAIKKLVL